MRKLVGLPVGKGFGGACPFPAPSQFDQGPNLHFSGA